MTSAREAGRGETPQPELEEVLAAVARQLQVSHEQARLRYLGQFSGPGAVAKHLFQIDSPHLNPSDWPYRFVDWEAAAADAEIHVGSEHFLVSEHGHWFDAGPGHIEA